MEQSVNKKALAKVTEKTEKSLDEIINVENTKMPEVVFKARYLDSFRKGGTDVAINEFTKIAGGPMREMDIVDNEGKVLFTTPPIYSAVDLSDLEPIKKGDMSGTALASIHNRNNNSDNPDEILDASLDKFSGAIISKVKECSAKNGEVWSEIFKRYDKTVIPETKTNVEFDYDD